MARKLASIFLIGFAALFADLGVCQTLTAPSASNEQESGPTANVEFGGTFDSEGQVYELNPRVGYEFNPHFGLAIGGPFYFIHPSSSVGGSSTSGPGDPYMSLHLKYPGSAVNFASALTGAAPIGDSKKGLSTGRATFDWTNHFDHAFSNLTPTIDVGIANTIADSRLFRRPLYHSGVQHPLARRRQL
jgi:hypothetical protein